MTSDREVDSISRGDSKERRVRKHVHRVSPQVTGKVLLGLMLVRQSEGVKTTRALRQSAKEEPDESLAGDFKPKYKKNRREDHTSVF